MPTYQFEAIDASTGKEIRDTVDAASEAEAQATIRSMGYMVTKLKASKAKAGKTGKGSKKPGRSFAIGGVRSKDLTLFTRQLSILQDAGLPILRSLKVLAEMQKPGRLRNSLLDVCDEIEGGSTLSEAMSKSPKAFDRLYCNMIRAGEAGGALEVILRRLAEFMERSESLRRKVKGALVYPVVVVCVAVGILTFIMLKIVPQFKKIFDDFGSTLPDMTQVLINISTWVANYWYLIPAIPFGINLIIKAIKLIPYGRFGWDLFTLKMPIFGQLVEKNILSRSARTLGTLLASGVPILEALNITKETSGNMMFERLFGKVSDSIRDGEAIAKPLKIYAIPPFNIAALLFWTFFCPGIGVLLYLTRYKKSVVDDLVVNMVDVGEESGELDTMLYKVADTYDEEVAVLTESLTSLMEPLLIIFLGGAVGFIVIALFMPLIKLIEDLS
jgi:type IV pilus assembly protein PilC